MSKFDAMNWLEDAGVWKTHKTWTSFAHGALVSVVAPVRGSWNLEGKRAFHDAVNAVQTSRYGRARA